MFLSPLKYGKNFFQKKLFMGWWDFFGQIYVVQT